VTASPHDALFKVVSDSPYRAVALVRALLPVTIAKRVAWSTLKVEPGSFHDTTLHGSRTDRLFSVRVAGKKVLVYVLLEHQSTSDPDMPLRMHVYLGRIWDHHKERHPREPLPLVIPIVVSHSPGGWSAPIALWDLLDPHPSTYAGVAELVPRFSFVLLDLSSKSNAEIVALARDAYCVLMLLALRDGRDAPTLLANLPAWQSSAEQLSRTRSGMRALGVLLNYVWNVTDHLHFERFRAKLCALVPTAESAIMTIAEQLRREGRAEGRIEGRIEANRQMLRKLLAGKFGALTPEHEARIADASLDELERYVERVLAATTIDDVLTV
jgi:predicted transposase YdaD